METFTILRKSAGRRWFQSCLIQYSNYVSILGHFLSDSFFPSQSQMAAMGLNIIFMNNKIQEPEGGARPSPQVFLFFPGGKSFSATPSRLSLMSHQLKLVTYPVLNFVSNCTDNSTWDSHYHLRTILAHPVELEEGPTQLIPLLYHIKLEFCHYKRGRSRWVGIYQYMSNYSNVVIV